ncbi:hypothetical protein J6590_103209 [Homalodisca vitripennis]|nr:hypothetical protein J6590_103209 [Homalodisca vitripennis]
MKQIPLKHHISAAKKKDVSDLLIILFEQDWQETPSLHWYINIIVGSPSGSEDEEVTELVPKIGENATTIRNTRAYPNAAQLKDIMRYANVSPKIVEHDHVN